MLPVLGLGVYISYQDATLNRFGAVLEYALSNEFDPLLGPTKHRATAERYREWNAKLIKWNQQ